MSESILNAARVWIELSVFLAVAGGAIWLIVQASETRKLLLIAAAIMALSATFTMEIGGLSHWTFTILSPVKP